MISSAAHSPLDPASHGPHDHDTAAAASRSWWDSDCDSYHAEHPSYLALETPGSEFYWCPEMLHEGDWQLLGATDDLAAAGIPVLEIGCGSASCTRWLAARGVSVVGVDISAAMLSAGRRAADRCDPAPREVRLIQADAGRLPFPDNTFPVVFSAFGALPFVPDLTTTLSEIVRVTTPSARVVLAVNHPFRWVFPDDPGPDGLVARMSYFSRTPYAEYTDGHLSYVEYHRTMGDWLRAFRDAGLRLDDLLEPEWPEHLADTWGQWSPLRGGLFPGTAIFLAHTPADPS